MSLSKIISVNTHYTRSINLERDYHSTALVESYIPTSRAVYALQKALSTLRSANDMPRAWSLVGPYGSGKSSFAVFLSHLLANPDTPTTQAALKVLSNTDVTLSDAFDDLRYNDELGHCVVLLTGSPEPLGKKLIKAVNEAAQSYWQHRRGLAPKEVRYLKVLVEQDQVSTTEIIQGIKGLQTAIGKIDGNGLLIVIDELGKFLEYEARHPETNDIYLLQALAELAYTGGKAALSIYVILHQSFDQYAKGLGNQLKNEWAKVHGRFESIPFLEASEQTLRIVANAIEHDSSIDLSNIKTEAKQIAHTLATNKALSGSLNETTASTLFAQCYPLHPLSALLLPILCQKVAQNERTLFNYLGSNERFGFKKSLSTLHKVGDWIYPWEVYEYFISNQSASLSDHFTHRRWAEVVTAVDRLGNADSNETQLLKAIGLFNIVGSQGGFKASKQIIEYCLPEKKIAHQTIESLKAKSIIQYRQYNNEYRVWQGSDFDIEEAVNNEIQKLGLFSIADYLNNTHEAQPIVARKFSIQIGSLRYFETAFTDSKTYQSLPATSDHPRVVFYLSQDREDSHLFQKKVVNHYNDSTIVAEFPQTEYLRAAIADVLALEKIQQSYQELHSDPIAQHEFKDRYQAASQVEQAKFAEILDHPENSHWYWQGEVFSVHNKRHLQQKLSSIIKDFFKFTPIIKNELINRTKPSSQATAGRNKLLYAMISHPHEEDLGIEKFPAEKSMYRAVLKETGLHTKINGEWLFTPPKTGSMVKLWQKMDTFLQTTEEKPRSFDELSHILTKPPYGVKEGLLSVFYLALYLANKDEIALYENKRYLPSLSKEELERFVKNPKVFTFQLFRIEGLNASLFQHYTDAFFPKKKPSTVIQAIRPLAQFIGNLNEYTHKTTTGLSKEAKALRSAFNLASSPEVLLFKGIPNALGYKKVNENNLEGYADALKTAIQELKYAYDNLLQQQQQFLANAFRITTKDLSLEDLRIQLRGRYQGLERYTVDTDGLKAFVIRLTNNKEDDQQWLQNLLMFLGNRVTEKWEDSHQSRAELRLSQYSRRILDLEALRLETEKTAKATNEDFEVILLKSLKQGAKERTEVIAIKKETHKVAHKIKEKLQASLNKETKDLQLAVLAELVDEFLQSYQGTSSADTKKPRSKLKKVNNG